MAFSKVDISELDVVDIHNLKSMMAHKLEVSEISEILKSKGDVKWDSSMYLGIDSSNNIVYMDIVNGNVVVPVDNYCEAPLGNEEFYFIDPDTYKVSVVNPYINISSFKYIIKANGKLKPYCVQTFKQEPDWYPNITKEVADEYLKEYRTTEDIEGDVIEGKYIKA